MGSPTSSPPSSTTPDALRVLLSEYIRKAAASLLGLYPGKEARALVEALCEDLLGVRRFEIAAFPGRELSADESLRLDEAMGRLQKGEPLQYVSSLAWFCGRPFKVNPSVLIPRPETSELVGAAVSSADGRPAKVLDLCTGSGCIAWTFALEVPGSQVTGVDISPAALEVASSQDFQSPSPQFLPPRFVEADILKPACDSLYPGPFDIILSNPPYIPERRKSEMHRNVLDFEPALALFVPDSDPMLFCRAIARISKAALRDGGRGWMEIDDELGEACAAVFEAAGLREVRILKDFFGKERMVSYSK